MGASWRPRRYAGHFSLTRHVVHASAAGLLVLVATGAGVLSTAGQLQQAQQAQARTAAARQSSTSLLKTYVDEETGLRGYVMTGEPELLAPYELAQLRLPGITSTTRAQLAAAGGSPDLLDVVDRAHARWSAYARAQIELVQAGDRPRASSTSSALQGKALFDVVRSTSTRVDSWLARRDADAQRRTQELQSRLITAFAVELALIALALVAGCLALWRGLTRPLSRLAAASRAVAAGDLSADLRADGAPEVRALAADVLGMRDRLTADLDRTRQALRSLEQEEPAVLAVRRALLPSRGELAGVRVTARLDPAEGVLAGDWFDTVPMSGPRLGIVLGDVAGHGPVSAVFALRLKHSLASALRTRTSPGAALAEVGRDLGDVADEMFATVFVCTVDTVAGVLTYASAGHPAALLLRDAPRPRESGGPRGQRRSGAVRPVGEAPLTSTELPATGPLLSPIVSGWTWGDTRVPFEVGSSLLVCTDGILESRAPDGAEFGLEGVLRAVEAVAGQDPARLIDAVAAASLRHAASTARRDDHTLVHVLREDVRAPRPRAH